MQANNELKRIPPTSVTYAEYCRRLDGTLDMDDGGQYTFYMDGAFLGDLGIQPGHNIVRQWTGDPMAIIRRAIHAVRAIISPSEHTKPVVEHLIALDDLYRTGTTSFAANDAAADQARRPDAEGDGQGQDDRASAPDPATAPSKPSPKHFSAAYPADAVLSSSTRHQANLRAIHGIPSPPRSLLPQPPKFQQKRSRANTDVNIETTTEPEQKRTKTLPLVEMETSYSAPPAKEHTDFDHIWDLFLQSTNTPDPNQDPFNNTVSFFTDHQERAPLPNTYDPLLDDKRFWRWHGSTAEDAAGYWRRNFLPLYPPDEEGSGDRN
jgi:hypothetical protein